MLVDREATATRLATVMARLASGDVGAMSDFYSLAEGPVRRMILHEFQSKGIWVDHDRLQDLVGDCLVELVRLAGSWRPEGGALPWRWAQRRLVAGAFRGLGLFTDEISAGLDPEAAPIAIGDVRTDMGAALRSLSDRDERIALLRDALDVAVTARDAEVWLEVLSETASGGPCPAATVGEHLGLSSANVRKICQRVRERLQRLAAEDATFTSLIELAGVAA